MSAENQDDWGQIDNRALNHWHTERATLAENASARKLDALRARLEAAEELLRDVQARTETLSDEIDAHFARYADED